LPFFQKTKKETLSTASTCITLGGNFQVGFGGNASQVDFGGLHDVIIFRSFGGKERSR
jgi:hypothetical protein